MAAESISNHGLQKKSTKRRKILTDKEELLAKRNASSKAIGQLMAKGLKEEAEAQKKIREEQTAQF